MGWFGAFIGGALGFQFGGIFGAILGASIGGNMGKRYPHARSFTGYSEANTFTRSTYSTVEQTQAAYFFAVCTLLGKFAKVDGNVSRHEEKVFYEFLDQMQIPDEQRNIAIKFFQEAKNTTYTIEELAGEFMRIGRFSPDSSDRIEVRLTLLDMLYRLAMADNEFHPEEERFLRIIAHIFYIPESHRQYIHKKYVNEIKKYYSILEVSPQASNEEIHSAYRSKVKEFHPDRLVAKGLPEEFIIYARKQFQEVQEAWEHIKSERNI